MSTLSSAERMTASLLSLSDGMELCVQDRFIGDDVLLLMCQKLMNDTKKTRIVLRGNCISPVGAGHIADLLKVNKHIRSISLEWNQISSAGAVSLASALESNSTLTSLDLRNNGITDEGAIALATCLEQHNTSIKSLDIRWNQITDKGGLTFQHCLLERQPTLFLQIGGNSITPAGMQTIKDWSSGNDTTSHSAGTAPSSSSSSSSSSALGQQQGKGGIDMNEQDVDDIENMDSQTATVRNSLLQKEISTQRHQNLALKASVEDLRRQVDAAITKSTDLEQQLRREEFRSATLAESLKSANSRISAQQEEYKNMKGSWDLERSEMQTTLSRMLHEKEQETRMYGLENESLKERLRKQEDDNERLRLQFDRVCEQSKVEKEQIQEELRSALNKCSVYATQEAKLTTDNISLKGSLTRATERLAIVESEFENCRANNEKLLTVEIEKREETIEKLKNEKMLSESAAAEKSLKSSKELTELCAKVTELEMALSRVKIAMSTERDKAVALAHESEKKRHEDTISELKTKLDVYFLSRNELEDRCASYVKEIATLTQSHTAAMEQMKAQTSSIEAELKRQRMQNVTLRDSLANSEVEARTKSRELEELKKKMLSTLEESEACHKSLQDAVNERQKLRAKVDNLEFAMEKAQLTRTSEYNAIVAAVTNAVNKEFENLRVNFKIKDT